MAARVTTHAKPDLYKELGQAHAQFTKRHFREAADILITVLTWQDLGQWEEQDLDILRTKEWLAACLYELGKFERAEYYYRQVLVGQTHHQNTKIILRARRQLAKSLYEQYDPPNPGPKEKCEEAMKLFEENLRVLSAVERHDDVRLVSWCAQKLADIERVKLYHVFVVRPTANWPLEKLKYGVNKARRLRQIEKREQILKDYQTWHAEKTTKERSIRCRRHWRRCLIFLSTLRALQERFLAMQKERLARRALCRTRWHKAIMFVVTFQAIKSHFLLSSARKRTLKRWKRALAFAVTLVRLREHFLCLIRDKTKENPGLGVSTKLSIAVADQGFNESENADADSSSQSSDEETTTIHSGTWLYNTTNTELKDKDSRRWIEEFHKFRNNILPEPFDHEDMQSVKLAVLDTGIDFTHPFIKQRWRRPEVGDQGFFDTFSDPGSHDLLTGTDGDGHGTHICGTILQLAPDVELYVARIGKTRDTMRKDPKVADRIASAIKHAASVWKVDIISMSFGREEIDWTIEFAIRAARVQNIIFLAAASNLGSLGRLSYPARTEGVLAIHAAKALGAPAEFNPPALQKEDNFSILGWAVESTWPSFPDLKPNSKRKENVLTREDGTTWKCLSGTSVAAPIAAAVVAVIFQYYDLHRDEMHLSRGSLGLKTYSAVRAVLNSMNVTEGGNRHDNIVPWRGRSNEWEWYGKSDKLADYLAFVIRSSE